MTREQRMHDVLSIELHPDPLIIDDESNKHNVPVGAETHFKIIAVSDQFNSLSRIQRHRLVNQLLNKEFNLGLHALSLHLYTPKEWLEQTRNVPASPACRDGKRY